MVWRNRNTKGTLQSLAVTGLATFIKSVGCSGQAVKAEAVTWPEAPCTSDCVNEFVSVEMSRVKAVARILCDSSDSRRDVTV